MRFPGLSHRRLAFLSLAWALSGGVHLRAAEVRFWVVVHPDNPAITLRRDQVSKLFLKQMTRWSDGSEAAPVDLVAGAPAREAFSREVHRRPATAIKKYWQQMVFSGQSAPPPELASDAEVLAMVRANPAAIGYVSDEATLTGVRIVDIVMPPPPPSGMDANPAR